MMLKLYVVLPEDQIPNIGQALREMVKVGPVRITKIGSEAVTDLWFVEVDGTNLRTSAQVQTVIQNTAKAVSVPMWEREPNRCTKSF